MKGESKNKRKREFVANALGITSTNRWVVYAYVARHLGAEWHGGTWNGIQLVNRAYQSIVSPKAALPPVPYTALRRLKKASELGAPRLVKHPTA